MSSKVGQDRTREEVCEYLSKNKWYPLLWVSENLIGCSTAFRGLLIRSEKLITFLCLLGGWRCCWQMGRAAAASWWQRWLSLNYSVFLIFLFLGCFGSFSENSSPSRAVCWWSHQVGCWKILIRYWLRLVFCGVGVFPFKLWSVTGLFKISTDLSLGFTLLQFPACKED